MAETDNKEKTPATPAAETAGAAASDKAAAPADKPTGRSDQGGRGGRGRHGGGRGGAGRGRRDGGRGRGRGGRGDRVQDEFESKIIDLARVTRVMAGGKRMSFRACVLVGDGKGRVGMGVKKGADVQLAVAKATEYAKKHLIKVPVVEGTIPHSVESKFKGARVLLKPAKAGTGVIAGGSVRVAMEMAGVHNVVAKIKGSSNKINNLSAVLTALKTLRTEEDITKLKG
jgi:small subunit ribosomal protein S5